MSQPLRYTLIACLIATPLMGLAAPALTDAQSKAVDARIGQYLSDHPESIIESLKQYQVKIKKERAQKAQQSLVQNKAALSQSDTSTTLGNPQGTIVITEFMDYRCGHCKSMGPILEQAIANNKNIKVVIKELPIFGGPSQFAAKIALAAAKQGQFAAVHKRLLKVPSEQLGKQDQILTLLKDLPLDQAKLKQDAASDAVQKQLADNHALAKKLYVNATPMFVVAHGDQQTMITGAISLSKLQQTIASLAPKKAQKA